MQPFVIMEKKESVIRCSKKKKKVYCNFTIKKCTGYV